MADDLDDILEVNQARQPARQTASPANVFDRDFPALEIIARIHKAFAVIALVMGLIWFLVVLVFPETTTSSVVAVIAVIAWTLFVPLFLWGSGELILVFLRIEQNTRRATELLSSPARKEETA